MPEFVRNRFSARSGSEAKYENISVSRSVLNCNSRQNLAKMPPKAQKGLLESDEEAEPLKINQNFAKKYETKKKKEDLTSLRRLQEVCANCCFMFWARALGEKSGSRCGKEDEDSISEEEDDDAEAVTGNLELNFFKTLAKLKADDPSIYDKSRTFFDEEPDEDDEDAADGKKKKSKPVFLKDYERQQLLAKGAKAFDSDDEGE